MITNFLNSKEQGPNLTTNNSRCFRYTRNPDTPSFSRIPNPTFLRILRTFNSSIR